MNLSQELQGAHRHWRRAAVAAAIAIAALLGRPEAAAASIITVTYTGTVEHVSIDYARIFGPFAVDLGGDPYTATFTFDTSKGTISHPNEPSFALQQLLEGPGVGTAVLTINGKSASFSSPTDGIDDRDHAPDSYAVLSLLHDTPNGIYIDAQVISGTDFTKTSDLGAPLDYQKPYSGSGQFYIPGRDSDTTVGFLFVDHVSISSVGGVPELGTWAMIIIGFGLVGRRLHPRNRVAA